MMKEQTAFLFPGQGSQFIGMGQDLYQNFPAAKEVFEKVDEALHQNLSNLMFTGNIEELTQTQNAQPAIMAVSMAVIRVLASQGFVLKEKGTFVAGHSLGEYTALCASEALTLEQTACILKERGLAMAEAGRIEAGGMMAVLGLEPDVVQQIATDSGCYVANDNGAGQWVLSGSLVALSTAKMRAETAGAKRVIPLPVAGAFHSPLMKGAQDKMRHVLAEIDFHAPDLPVIANVSAQAEKTGFCELLERQIVAPVRWRESVLYMHDQGISHFVECGPGTVLSGLVRRILPDSTQAHIGDTATLQAFLEAIQKNT